MENLLTKSGITRGKAESSAQLISVFLRARAVVRTFQQLLRNAFPVRAFRYAVISTSPRIHRSNSNLV